MTNFNNNTFEAKDLDEMSEHEGALKNGLKQSLEGSDTLKNFFTEFLISVLFNTLKMIQLSTDFHKSQTFPFNNFFFTKLTDF